MGKILTIAVVLATALTFGSASGVADDTTVDVRDTTAAGVYFDWMGDTAKVVIVGEPGSSYAAYDSNGTPLAGGVLDRDRVRFYTGTNGTGIFVVVDDEIVASVDPDWEWH